MIRLATINDKQELDDMLSNFNVTSDFESFNKYLLNIKEEIVGFISYTHLYDKIEINYIYTKPNYRYKGYAEELVDYLIQNGEYKDITLEVRVSNKSAIKLYEKKGFKIVATRPNYYSNEDAYLMHKGCEL